MPTKGSKNFLKKIKKNKRTRKVKKQEKSKYKQQKNKQQKNKKQQGGKSPSCLVKPDVSKYVNNSCHTANLHNTNPEVDYSLITEETDGGKSILAKFIITLTPESVLLDSSRQLLFHQFSLRRA